MKHSPLTPLSLVALVFVVLVCEPASKTLAQGRPISLPPKASEIAQGIYDLGVARDVDGTVVHGFAFIHYRKAFARPDKLAGSKPAKASPCYAFMASGAKWKGAPEPFVFDMASGTDAGVCLTQIETAISTWEAAAQRDILGNGSLGVVFPDQLNAPNGQNEVMFGHLDDSGVIAMTQVWGVWDGPPAGRQLVEWDMVFGIGWAWWNGVDPKPFTFTDFLSIATHEIGHAMGLDHPSDTCTEETMYAYSGWSETKKRDLNAGDIAGIQKLYP
jgi:hypothetical protein